VPRWVQTLVEWFRAHPLVSDALLAAAIAALSVTAFTSRPVESAGSKPADLLGLVLVVAACLPLAFRRRAPIPVLALTAAPLLVILATERFESGTWVAVLVAAYTVTAHERRRPAALAMLALAAAFSALTLVGIAVGARGATWSAVVANLFVLAGVWVLGDSLFRRRERVAHLEQQAAQTEREQLLLARQAVSDERARIARELHDVVAHSVSLMTVQAGAARRILTRDPERAASALGEIEETGRTTMAELRRLVGVLRDGETAERDPVPSLARVADLVTADPALAVQLRVEGDPVPLPTAVDLSAYRIVQESLTNVRKHAGPARAEVVVRYLLDAVEVEVRDDGRGATVAVDPGGHGLVGMHERAALCGGRVAAGPRRGGGWQVRAHLPLHPPTVVLV
jgi:signal transduction histidine kinase